MEEEKKKSKKLFAIRVILWSLFSCVIPVSFIAWRYNLFDKVGKVQLTGWGLVAIIIITAFIYVFARYIRAGFVEWSMFKQILDGVVKIVIPLCALLALCVSLKNSLELFIQALSCVIFSEVIAIPLNPFPQWIWEKSQGRFEGMVDFIANKFNEKKGDKE